MTVQSWGKVSLTFGTGVLKYLFGDLESEI